MKWYFSLAIILIVMDLSHGNLYNSSDPMTILTEKNFQNEVFRKPNAWVIEFYLEWCGHCVNFASVWRDFAYNIADWDHTIKVGAIDCADKENLPICKHYNVDKYPHIRLFGSYTLSNSTGEPALSRTAEALTMEIIEFLVGHQNKGTAANTWTQLLPFRGTLAELTPNEADSSVVIIANDDMNEGTLTVMDLGNYPQVYVRTMNPSFARSIGLQFDSVPVLVTLDKNGNQEILVPDEKTREGFTDAIFKHFGIVRREITSDPVTAEDQDTSATTESIIVLTNSSVDVVYKVDMDNAISYALRHEVFLQDSITGDALLALKNFVHALVRFYPGEENTQSFLSKLYNFIVKHRDVLKGSDYGNALNKLETSDSYLPEQTSWLGCKGSKTHLRGYPCGLWTLFHTLSVNAVIKEGNSTSYFPQEVLEAIHGYVKYFFGCQHCSKHFQEMYALDAKRLVQSPGDEILWLWRAHNKVNKRLKGDKTEDPMHPKSQFPTKKACPRCFDWKDDYIEARVVEYVNEIYGSNGISTLGASMMNGGHYPTFSLSMIASCLLFAHLLSRV